MRRERTNRKAVLRGVVALLSGFSLVLLSAMPSFSQETEGALRTTAEKSSHAVVLVRVETDSGTLLEKKVVTTGHTVTTVSGGTHQCDGTNNDAHPNRVPVATAALDDAASVGGLTWDGTFSMTFDDYFVTRIGNTAQTGSQFWGVLLNYQMIPVGGCQQQVATGDEVLFAFDAFNKQHALKLTGPNTAFVGQTKTVTVVDGATGVPVAGAVVSGQVTGADGKAQITFISPGIHQLKAERADSIRSNALVVKVKPRNLRCNGVKSLDAPRSRGARAGNPLPHSGPARTSGPRGG